MKCRERSERKILGKLCTFPPNSSKLRSDYLFSFQKRTDYLFPVFLRSEYLFPKSASPPPPPQNQMVVPLLLIRHKNNKIQTIIHLAVIMSPPELSVHFFKQSVHTFTSVYSLCVTGLVNQYRRNYVFLYVSTSKVPYDVV